MTNKNFKTSWIITAIILLIIKAFASGYVHFQNLKYVFQNTENSDRQLALFLSMAVDNFVFLGLLIFLIVVLIARLKGKKEEHNICSDGLS